MRLLPSSARVLAFGLFLLAARDAAADVYKYKKPDGTVVYTDNLSQLPPERREFYAKQKEEQDRKRQELERAVGKEELERREAEAKRQELERAKLDDAERQQRLKAIDAQLAGMQQRRKEREASREAWRKRMQDAEAMLKKRLAEFHAASDRYNAIAIKPSFSLLPGEAEELEKAKKDMERLEKEVDFSIQEVEVTIPEEARKAGIPPGYLR